MLPSTDSFDDSTRMSYKGKERASDEDEMEEGEQQDNLLPPKSESAEQEYRDDAHPDYQDSEPRSQRTSELHNETVRIMRCFRTAVWVPKHVLDRPKPPTREEREAELALLEAQARAGQGTNDPRAKSRIKVRWKA